MDKKLRDKDNECKELERELGDTKKKNDKLDAKNKKLEGLMDKQHQKLMEEKDTPEVDGREGQNKELNKDMDELKGELHPCTRHHPHTDRYHVSRKKKPKRKQWKWQNE
eukprot:1024689_1